MQPPLHFQRMTLALAAVQLQCLDRNKTPLARTIGSGFIRREADRLFLYTCWHLVSGFDPYDLRFEPGWPKRRYLQIALPVAAQRQPGVEAIGGVQTHVLPLYDGESCEGRPLWLQDDRHIPDEDLNDRGLFVPFLHDVVKLELPPTLPVSKLQIIDEKFVSKGDMDILVPGDKCVVVGFPYGYSVMGSACPIPIALTRFVAGGHVIGRGRQFLLGNAGAPGMSGGPVYLERQDHLFLWGIYTGAIYPDNVERDDLDNAFGRSEKTTALGTVSDLTLVLSGTLPLVRFPSAQHGG
jgi:hypothetical protein